MSHEEEYSVMVVVVPRDGWESIAERVDSWALVGEDHLSFDEANGLMTVIENGFSE